MNTHESYVSLETAKLLKEKGFDWECKSLYCTDVRYKGNSIDEDEEYELKAEGKGSEIEYVDGGMICDIWNTNNSGFVGYSRPPLAIAQRWLREVHNLSIEVYRTACGYISAIVAIPSGTDIKFLEEDGDDLPSGQFTKWEYACEAAIKYCLEHLIHTIKS